MIEIKIAVFILALAAMFLSGVALTSAIFAIRAYNGL